MQDFLKILPMAFVMIAGPQIISAVFLATSEEWKKNSAAYIAGTAVTVPLFVSLSYLVGKSLNSATDSTSSSSSDTMTIIIVVVLLALMVVVFLKREESEPPKWMGKLQTATPKFSFILGFLLLGIFPTDIMTSFVVGSHLAHEDLSLSHALPFIGLTVLLIATPALMVAVMGERAQRSLPKLRDWMNANSWIISEIVLAFFVVLQFT